MGEQIRNYFATGIGQITAYLPALVSGIIILAIGYVVSRLLGGLVSRLLARARFDSFVARRLHPKAGAPGGRAASATTGSAVFWLGMLVTLSMAARALRLGTLSAGIDRILAYIPNVFVAAIIVGVAFAVANVLASFIANVSSAWLARGARVAIIALSIFMALDQLGIAQNIVLTAFAAVVGAAAVAAAIAFGVGGIDVARGWAQRWDRRGRAVAELRGEQPPFYPEPPAPHVTTPTVGPTGEDTGPRTH